MSLDNLKIANEVIRELQALRTEKTSKSKSVFDRMMKESPVKKRRPPGDFKDSSFLYLRSYDGDNGIRPGANVAYWRSPDLNVSPVSSLNSYTTGLNVGTLYNIKCLVHNSGDIIVPSAKVEFYLINPSLGMDTRFAKKLGITATWVNCYSSAEVNIQYLISPSDAGHKCLFARTFSFSPLDIPIHDTILNPIEDRHIAQKNLNIVQQSTQMQMNILHMPQSELTVHFSPLAREAILAFRHPSSADFKILNYDRKIAEFKMNFESKVFDSKIKSIRGKTVFYFNEKGKFSMDNQKNIKEKMNEITKMIQHGKAKASEFKDQIEEYRQMNLEKFMTPLNLEIPNLGLQKGEMMGFEVIATDNLNGEIFGGITLLVIG